MQDPFQNYQLLGATSAGASPFGLPHTVHPLAQGLLQNPWLQSQLIQSQLIQNPLLAALHSPLLQNPVLQNPLLTAGLQNPYQTIPQQPFGYPLAPQTLIGASNPYGIGQPFTGQPFAGSQTFGQIHPLVAQQIALRSLATAGMSPWGCY
jgi:hypothetical protein